jgi:hypothetical protein
MKLAQIICCMAVIICTGSCSRTPDSPVVTTSRFEPGQVWTFHTPTNEPSSATLTVARVDFDSKLGPIIFISVTGLQYDTWRPYHFMPVSENALSRSVIALVKTNAPLTGEDLQAFQQFYESGRQGVERGELDKCFKITVAEVLEKDSGPPRDSADKKPWWHFW